MRRRWTTRTPWALGRAVAPPRVRCLFSWAPLVAPSKEGFLGRRFLASARSRIMAADEEEMLEGFRCRPGSHPWVGEHAGKWLHAACWTATIWRAPELIEKTVRVAEALMDCQERDGYLGTYDAAHRFGLEEGHDWDVWVHKYVLIGLLAYHRLMGDGRALVVCGRAADRLLAEFGPGKRSILEAGTHAGMAATSVMEPIVRLYRATGLVRYLEFARTLVEAWSGPGGPDILRGLRQGCGVDQVANGKAYELLSNLLGLVELYRQSGERVLLEAPLAAFEDIVAHRRLVTGGMSVAELFVGAGREPRDEGAKTAETCVTVTWIQLCRELLAILGEARFADEIERAALNHLFAAQAPAGDMWCYYTPLEGVKPYDRATTCCRSSGPRAVALLPWTAVSEGPEGVFVHLYEPGRYRLDDGAAGERRLEIVTDYPYDGRIRLRASGKGPVVSRLALRIPGWAGAWRLSCGKAGASGERAIEPSWVRGYAIVPEGLRAGEEVCLDLSLDVRLRPGRGESTGRVWVTAGPLVYGLSARLDPSDRDPARVALMVPAEGNLGLADLPASAADLAGQRGIRARCRIATGGGVRTDLREDPAGEIWLTDFAHTGTRGERFEMALLAPRE